MTLGIYNRRYYNACFSAARRRTLTHAAGRVLSIGQIYQILRAIFVHFHLLHYSYKCGIIISEREVNKMDRIKNCPDYAKDYEFVVVRQDDNGDYWFWGAYENGFKAEQVCLEISGVIFHNVRIQGKK